MGSAYRIQYLSLSSSVYIYTTRLILVAEAGKMLFFVPIFSVYIHDTENNFVFEAISSFIQKKKIQLKIEFKQLSEK